MPDNQHGDGSVVRALFAHNTWANLKLLDFCERLNDEQLDTAAVGGYGTIRTTLSHIFRAEVGYVRTPEGLEVDFLARRPGARAELIQVCADLATPEARAREVRALRAAETQQPRARRLLLSLDRDALSRLDVAGIEARPVYEWLLEDPGVD